MFRVFSLELKMIIYFDAVFICLNLVSILKL